MNNCKEAKLPFRGSSEVTCVLFFPAYAKTSFDASGFTSAPLRVGLTVMMVSAVAGVRLASAAKPSEVSANTPKNAVNKDRKLRLI